MVVYLTNPPLCSHRHTCNSYKLCKMHQLYEQESFRMCAAELCTFLNDRPWVRGRVIEHWVSEAWAGEAVDWPRLSLSNARLQRHRHTILLGNRDSGARNFSGWPALYLCATWRHVCRNEALQRFIFEKIKGSPRSLCPDVHLYVAVLTASFEHPPCLGKCSIQVVPSSYRSLIIENYIQHYTVIMFRFSCFLLCYFRLVRKYISPIFLSIWKQ
jgi:hypothetical protein